MTEINPAPKVFISYSWKPFENKKRTIELAERLSTDGVHVIIDVWDLTEGQDKYQFMEKMVNDPEIKRVLLICNKDYKDKADSKKGGVGSESLIISNEIYSHADQTKFIPIIVERDEHGKEYIPTFAASRIYIDLSQEDGFEVEYEKLIRNIFNKPESKRPPLGSPPPYIENPDPVFLKTAGKVRTIKTALLAEKKNTQVFVDDYYKTFIDSLKDFEISEEEMNKQQFPDELILAKIEELKYLRDDFINFLDVILTYYYDFKLDRFISFLSSLLEIIVNQRSNDFPSNSRGAHLSDQYKFFFYEIFLYTFSHFARKERYDDLGTILHNEYVIRNKRENSTYPYNYFLFNQYVESIDKYRNERLQLRRISITADLIKLRADNSLISFSQLQESDILLYFISLMMLPKDQPMFYFKWAPKLSIYRDSQLTILHKMISLREFEKIKPLFGVCSIDELKTLVTAAIPIDDQRTSRFELNFPSMRQAFNFQEIGTLK